MSDLGKKLAEYALTQVGVGEPNGDDKYIKYYNEITGSSFSVNSTPWCAIFVTYCARQVGIPTEVIPNFASCTISRDQFWKPKNQYHLKSGYQPKVGDIIYFDWGNNSSLLDHVGIVVGVTSTTVTTVEGNSKGNTNVYGVRKKTYNKTLTDIDGYAAPGYDGDITDIPDGGTSDDAISIIIKEHQKWLNTNYKAGLILDGSFGPLTRAATIKAYQTVLNCGYGRNLAVDGSFGPATKAAAVPIQYGAIGNLVRIAQGLLYGHKLNPNGYDGSFGPGMLNAIKLFQSKAGIAVDGSCGPDTWKNLFSSKVGWYTR